MGFSQKLTSARVAMPARHADASHTGLVALQAGSLLKRKVKKSLRPQTYQKIPLPR